MEDINSTLADSMRKDLLKIKYGNSGLRTDAKIVESVAFRLGIAAAEYSKVFAPHSVGIPIKCSNIRNYYYSFS